MASKHALDSISKFFISRGNKHNTLISMVLRRFCQSGSIDAHFTSLCEMWVWGSQHKEETLFPVYQSFGDQR